MLSSMLSSHGDRPTVALQTETPVPGMSSWTSLGASPSSVTFRSQGRGGGSASIVQVMGSSIFHLPVK